ncbi:SRPBCC family protein [Nonomuraea turcica]|uniref:hypothetical protein n=1 Tax=Nonomuraea sp. G32 TaxID=3067274 RepID=UPI00273BFDFF|nr:hypothetical protein [Nonomuraea sp. G32]MDP4511606.1 hypothetical protein [Nonomuraea sp. G32]
MSQLADRLIPRPDAAERHSIVINAPRERVWDALTHLRSSDVRLAKPLFAARALVSRSRGGRPHPGMSAFTLLAEDPGREVVLGTVGQWWRLGRAEDTPSITTAGDFDAFDRPGYAKGTFSFVLEEAGSGRVRLVTETRVLATSSAARRAFLRYWAVIRLGSGLVRHIILSAVRARATQAP